MAQAKDYPVTFAYGAKDGYYYGANGIIGAYHRGDDRAMPSDTPVIVNGAQIGLSGSTGASSGPHLHLGKWNGGVDVNPQGRGFDLANASVHSTGYDSVNGYYVRIAAEGYLWVYLHLNRIDVKQGQTLTPQGGGTTMGSIDLGQARVLAHGVLGRNGMSGRPNALAGECDVDLNKNHVGRDASAKIWEFYNSAEGLAYREDTVRAYVERDALRTHIASVTADRDQLIVKFDARGKEITSLTATVGELQQQLNEASAEIAKRDASIVALEKSIETKDTEIKRLNEQLASVGDSTANLSGWELVRLGINKLLKGNK